MRKAGIYILALLLTAALPVQQMTQPVWAGTVQAQAPDVGENNGSGEAGKENSGNTGDSDTANHPSGSGNAGEAGSGSPAKGETGSVGSPAKGETGNSGSSVKGETGNSGSLAEGEKGNGGSPAKAENGTSGEGDSQKEDDRKDDSGSAGEHTPGENTSVMLKIDNTHIYDGMKEAYRQGYIPLIEDGKAILVLPLLTEGSLRGNRLTASLDLGDPSKNPFVYKNYEKDIRLTKEPVNGGTDTVEVYYVRFDLMLTDACTGGVYPVILSIKGRDAYGAPVEQTFTTYVTIPNTAVSEPSGDGDDTPNTGDAGGGGGGGGAPAEEKPSSQPIILVEKVQLTDGDAEAGKPFTAVVTLKNTSKKKAVQNMVVTISCESPQLTLLNASNTIYIERMGKGETTDIQISYQTAADTPEGKYDIQLAMSYDNEEAATLTSGGTFSVSVHQPMGVEMTMPMIDTEVHAGDTLPLSFQVMNLGRSMIYNVRCDLSGEGLVPANTAFIGNMEAGTAQTSDMNVFVSTLDGEEAYGPTSGTVTLTYEDVQGKVYTQTFDFQTTITKPVIGGAVPTQEKEQTAGQWWISVLIAGGLALLAAVGVLIRRGRHEVV